MKTLFVLRHAKSSWDHPELSDFQRPLNPRGKRAAPRIGAEMTARGYEPKLVLSSSAERAKETTRLVLEGAGIEPEIRFDREIYGAAANTLLYIVAQVPSNVGSVMIVGHNPGFEMLVAGLTGESRRMPTAALAAIEFETESWDQLEAGMGVLKDHLVPKELKKSS
ncbi:MAG: histidine phosphatase family protein [Pyrinomonadaceae bacterium]|nr:histidine phosphatase family protein [Pyrinomonadaceae bacterium]